jgi:adenylate cyclase
VTDERPVSDDLPRRLTRRLIWANLVAGSLVVIYFDVAAPPYHASKAAQVLASAGSFVAFSLVMVPVLAWRTRKRLALAVEWLEHSRPPTLPERDAVLELPWRLAVVIGRAWFVVAIVASSTSWQAPRYGASVFVGIAIGGLTAAGLSFLLAERLIRPTAALVLEGEAPEQPRTIGLRSRIMLAWALGSGIPLLAIALTPLVHTRGSLPLAVAIVFMAGVGLVAGLDVTSALAASVAEPLTRVRAGMRLVRSGQLDGELVVDDAGEIGLLQSGFNQMVAGLRERERLNDLFGRHVGADVARQALERGVTLGGEERDISALFVDLVNSTALADGRRPDEVVAVLNQFFEAVVSAVSAEGGWVNKFEGDGALCVFGAPVDQPDHAARALRAASALRDRLVTLGLAAGIGVSSGAAVAGNVGAEERYEYTVIGRPVHEAARVCELAKQRACHLLAADATIIRAGEAVGSWSVAGEVELRGFAHATRVYEA